MVLVFQIPTLAFFLAKIRLITARFLWRNIRYAVLIIFIAAAVLTPSPDPWNMGIFAAPMLCLYLYRHRRGVAGRTQTSFEHFGTAAGLHGCNAGSTLEAPRIRTPSLSPFDRAITLRLAFPLKGVDASASSVHTHIDNYGKRTKKDHLQGSLDLLVLRTLASPPRAAARVHHHRPHPSRVERCPQSGRGIALSGAASDG